jgi:hypothetical protein
VKSGSSAAATEAAVAAEKPIASRLPTTRRVGILMVNILDVVSQGFDGGLAPDPSRRFDGGGAAKFLHLRCAAA